MYLQIRILHLQILYLNWGGWQGACFTRNRLPGLDSANSVEVEITEEQEAWLKWMIQHEIEHVRL